jgi:hypothetical protein
MIIDIDDDYDNDYDELYASNDDSYKNVHLESLVDLIEVEYKSRVGEIKEMIKNVSSKQHK